MTKTRDFYEEGRQDGMNGRWRTLFGPEINDGQRAIYEMGRQDGAEQLAEWETELEMRAQR